MPLGGTLIAISERGLDAARQHQGFLIGGASPGEFTVKRVDEFDVSDCAVTPGGDFCCWSELLLDAASPCASAAFRSPA